MMLVDQTESQELMVINQFIKKNGRTIIIALLLLTVVILGSNYWRRTKANSANAAAQVFQEMLGAELQQDSLAMQAKGEQLISDFSNTPYAQFASLILAKSAVASDNLDKAAENLQWVIDKSDSKQIAKHLATVRLAAVLTAQNKLDAALELVAKDPDAAYVALYAQARGDVLVAKGDIEQAKKAYMLALQSLPSGARSPSLQMKLLDLGGDQNA